MEYKRNCPICFKELTYKSRDSYNSSLKANSSCKSCSIKRLYELDPGKNKGDRNGRTGKLTIDVFRRKYGDAEGEFRYSELQKKLSDHGFKSGKENIAYGKIYENSGRSYKGWYKGLFFRSSLELYFLVDFESKNGTLPLSAEGKAFRITYSYGQKTYSPDFFDPHTNTIFEIKPQKMVSCNSEKIKAALLFVEGKNLQFKVVTDKDLKYVESGVVWKLKRMVDEGDVVLTDHSVEKLKKRIKKISESVNSYKKAQRRSRQDGMG